MNKKIVIISTILLIIDQITKSLVELSDVHISIISISLELIIMRILELPLVF